MSKNKKNEPNLPATMADLEMDSQMFHILLDSLPDTIYFKNSMGRFIRVNQAQAEMLGISKPADAVGKTDSDFFKPEFAAKAQEDEQKILKRGESVVNLEEQVLRKDGSIRWVTATKVPIYNMENDIIGMVGMSRDITQQKRTEKKLREIKGKLEEMTRTDPLTALLNRRGASEVLDYEKKRSDRNGFPFSVVLGDLDDFKNINDNMGHDAGDYVLEESGRLIRTVLREQDTASRWGGEEFLVILPSTDLEGGVALAERLRSAIDNAELKFNDYSIHFTISLGVSCYQFDEPVRTVIKRADVALYKSKKDGKNRVLF